MSETKEDLARVITPVGRIGHPSVFEATAFKGGEEKFSCTIFWKKSVPLEKMKEAAHAAKVKKWGADKSKWPKGLRNPFRDGDEKADKPGYAGTYYVRASNKYRPEVVDQNRQPISKESDEFYAGCYGRMYVQAFAYDNMGNRGVSFSLEMIQKHSDGERFSGRKSVTEVFDIIEDNESEESPTIDNEDDDAGF